MAEPPPVVNASPIILLHRIDALALLRTAGDALVVPEAVMSELSAKEDGAARAAVSASWLSVVAAPPPSPTLQAFDLGAGETAVLAWAEAHSGTVAILDDRAARDAASELGVGVRGTIGLVLLAKQRGQIRSARSILEDLQRSGMYLARQLVEDALKLVGE